MTPESTQGSTPSPGVVRYSTRTKVVVVVVLALAAGAFALAFATTTTDDDPTFTVSGAVAESVVDGNGVLALIPGNGDEILGQEGFGIEVEPGWRATLVLLPGNGPAIEIPEDEMDDRVAGLFRFQPGEGKVVERLIGDYCVAATIWSQVRGRSASERVTSWCFSAT